MKNNLTCVLLPEPSPRRFDDDLRCHLEDPDAPFPLPVPVLLADRPGLPWEMVTFEFPLEIAENILEGALRLFPPAPLRHVAGERIILLKESVESDG